MRNLIRSPLTWMVAAELVVVGALVVVAWNVVASANRPAAAAAPAVTASDAGPDQSSPLPAVPNLELVPLRGPLPGLSVDPAFWRDRLASLNSDQVELERLEWAIVHSAEQAVNHYLETVVLPAVQHAERAGGAVMA